MALYRCHVGEDCPDLTGDWVLDERERGEAERDCTVVVSVRVVVHFEHAGGRLAQPDVREFVEDFLVVVEPGAAVT